MLEAGVLIHRSSDYQPKNVQVPVKVAERATLGAGNSPASTVLLNVKRLAASHLFRHPISSLCFPLFRHTQPTKRKAYVDQVELQS